MNKERKLIIAGNWKMNKTVAEALDLVRGLKLELTNVKEVDIVVCPAMPTPAFPHDQAPHQFPNPEPRHIDIDGRPFPYLDQLVWSGIATLPSLPATVTPVERSAAMRRDSCVA